MAVSNVLGQRAQRDATLSERLRDVEQIAQATPQPVELPDDECVPTAKIGVIPTFVPRLPTGSQSATLCAVAALERWLAAVGGAGLVFRTFDLRGRLTEMRLDPGDVARILRRRAAAAGVEGDFAGHSLRAWVHHQRREEEGPIESIKRVTDSGRAGSCSTTSLRQRWTTIRRCWRSSGPDEPSHVVFARSRSIW